jgi:hypothetical protein
MVEVLQDKRDGKAYKSGINAPKPDGNLIPKGNPKKSKPEGPTVTCSHCRKLGHARRSHHSCGTTIYTTKGKLKLSNQCCMIYVIKTSGRVYWY